MFGSLNPASSRQRSLLAVSLSSHAILFAWLLHQPDPQLLQASSVVNGHNGRVLTTLYWPSEKPDDNASSSPDNATEVYRHQRLGHEKLIWKQTSTPAKLPLPSQLSHITAEDKSKVATLSNLGHGAAAGMPFGSVPGSPVYGDEIRPALPIATSDPVVYPWQRPDSEGKVIIEITIDERGEIIRKTVLQSLGPVIDGRCLTALENWRFQPATHNGIPIPSKQDAIFPFKARA